MMTFISFSMFIYTFDIFSCENVSLLKIKETCNKITWEKDIYQGHSLVSGFNQTLLCSVPSCHHCNPGGGFNTID